MSSWGNAGDPLGDRGLAEVVRALLESEDSYQLVFARERDAMSLFDAETGRFLHVNAAWRAQYGYTLEEALAMTPADVNVDPGSARASIAKATAGAAGAPVLKWHRRRDGTEFPVELVCGSFVLRGRRAVYAVMRDVSERVAAEEALRRSEREFRALIESLPDAIVVHQRGVIVYANPAASALVGGQDLRGVGVLQNVHPSDRDTVAERVRGGARPGVVYPIKILRGDGSVGEVEISTIPITYEGAPAVLGIGRDVTERNRMERRIATSDRLASLGRLAASVGHEINNPLAWMVGNVEILERELEALAGAIPDDARRRLTERLEAISEGAERVRVVVRDLKTLSRDDDGPARPVDLHRTLDRAAAMATHELRHRARFVRIDHASPVRVRGHEARLGQVFLNLLVNAAQAIPEGAVHENEVRVRTEVRAAPGAPPLASIEVEDTGRGIPDEALDRIFEPFFTTKPPGTGMGLGLSISHHIVASLGGRIEVERLAPRGTRFRVLLPIDESAPVEAPPPPPVQPPSMRRARVLVVDDQPPVAQVIAGCLPEHEVVLAHSGREALARIAASSFDVVLCDLMMGDLTGMDVYEQLERDGGGLERRMVLITGGAHSERARALLERVPNTVVEKPFARERIREVVRELLDRPA